MTTPEFGRHQKDLRMYLQDKQHLFPCGTEKVIAQVNQFTSAIVSSDFQHALATQQISLSPDRPFIEICDEIVERHNRFLNEPDRDMMAKSLLEAYIYAAGSECAFEPASKTRITSYLRRRGAKGFAASLLSLYLFNLISIEIQDEVRANTPDLKSFEIYMLWVETECRQIVVDATPDCDGSLDEKWAAAVCGNIERRLLTSKHS